MAELEIVVASLPQETRFPLFPLRQYGGFWHADWILPGVAAAHARFEPRPGDVFLASVVKSGTTWLKALAFATLHRADHPPRDRHHPLRRSNPHECVEFLEMAFALSADDGDVFAPLPSPRVLATHLAYPLLPASITVAGSGCRIVYVCRDPKDAFVSWWLFTEKAIRREAPAPTRYTMEESFELFCDGRCIAGPQWDHVLSYWEESRRRPDDVLFLRYEEMLRDPVGSVKKLAQFMGRGFSVEEEAAGVVQDIVDLCSLGTLKNLEVNRNGAQQMFENESFFRMGVAGDWSNHLTPAMAARLDKIVADALQGSGLTFKSD